ncbi:MAG: murein biosynthesis integral membrane protein MurJ [Myxococcota bacterium]
MTVNTMSESPATKPAPPTPGKSVARSAGTVGLFTLVSRVGGLLRDALFGSLFGAGTASDAYFMAFTIPNTFRTLVAEGSLTVAFLPVFREAENERGAEAGKRLIAHAFVFFPGLAACIAGVAVIAAEPLVLAFAEGFRDVPGKFDLTVALTRIMFAYLPLVSFVALAMGGLNARRHFATSAASPAVFNLTVIGGLLSLSALVPELSTPSGKIDAVYGVAITVVLGGVSQVLLQLWGLRRAGLLTWPRLGFPPEIRRIVLLMVPALGALAVYQFNILIVRHLASSLAEGSVTALFFADRFFQLPLGVFGIAIATASLPALADAHLEGGGGAVARTLRRSLELNTFIAVPATAGLMVLALPICATVLQHGAFSHARAQQTAEVLLCLAPGLLAVASIRVVSQAFFSMQDTRTPVACSAIGVATNLALAPHLAGLYEASGLALSLSVSAWAQLCVQLVLLRRRVKTQLGVRHVVVKALRAGLVATLMASASGGIATLGAWEHGLSLRNLLVLLLSVSVGAALYGLVQWTTRSSEAVEIASALRRRLLR